MATDVPPTIEPVYATAAPNDAISLYAGELEAAGLAGAGRVVLELLPVPRLSFELAGVAPMGPCEVRLVGRGAVGRGRLLESADGTVRGELAGVALGTPPHLGKVVFNLVNFPGLADRLALRGQGWGVVVEAVPGVGDRLQARGGYAFTHLVQLTRLDGARFTVQQAEELLEALALFFSFLGGRPCPAVLPVGFDTRGERAWERWAAPAVGPWQGASHWLPAKPGPAAISSLLERFLALWGLPGWPDALRAVIGFYLEASQGGGMASGALSSQAGLELLSWSVFVNPALDPALQENPQAFERQPASQRVDKLLERAKLGLDVPAAYGDLARFVATLGVAANGPKAVAILRNKLVHPTSANRGKVAGMLAPARHEAGQLALGYLELALLHTLGYPKGSPYFNRATGAQATVPW